MQAIYRWLQALHDDVISNDYDRVVIVLGGEGDGKSTFILGAIDLWYRVLGRCSEDERPDPDRILQHVTFDSRPEFKQQLLSSDSKDPLAVMDAAHILHNKEAMHGEQVDIEKTLLDIRFENFLIFLGYQDWGDVPDQLRRRRAKNVIQIPERGKIRGYGRDSIDEKYNTGDWPEPDLEDTFPSLEGRELWQRFNDLDAEQKRERLEDDTEPDPEQIEWQAKAEMAVYLHKPWNDSDGMTQSDAGDVVGYSRNWVSERCAEWEKGELEPDMIAAIPEPHHGGVMAA